MPLWKPDWAASLIIGGVTGWRLPKVDTSCDLFTTGTTSEFGHLFYSEFGGMPHSSILNNTDPDINLFHHLRPQIYWADTAHPTFTILAYTFSFGLDNNGVFRKNSRPIFAWAVHDGDVSLSPVPEPDMYAMMSAGLLTLLGFAGLRNRL
jgi:hypothetical protein